MLEHELKGAYGFDMDCGQAPQVENVNVGEEEEGDEEVKYKEGGDEQEGEQPEQQGWSFKMRAPDFES